MKTWDPAQQPTGEVWIGTIANEWPVRLFVLEAHAIAWADTASPGRRRIWRATVTLGEELEYVPPGAARLISKESGS